MKIKETGMDLVSIAETVLYNYPVKQAVPLPAAGLTQKPFVSICESVERALYGSRNPAILLSAGYDSRVLLAAALSSGHRPTAVTWNRPNPSDETILAKKIASDLGLSFCVLNTESRSRAFIEEAITEFAIRTKGELSTSRSLVASSIREMSDQYDVILWGEGELIRPPLMCSEYLSRAALSVLIPGEYSVNLEQSFPFNPQLPYDQALLNAKTLTEASESLARGKKLAVWLINHSYPGIYGKTVKSLFPEVRAELPFMDRMFLSAFVKSGCSIAEFDKWSPSLALTMRSRRLYHSILKEIGIPELLSIPTDRGYPPSWDADYRGVAATLIRGIRSRLGNITADPPSRIPYQKCVVSMLLKLTNSAVCHPELSSFLSTAKFPLSSSIEYELGKLLSILISGEYQ